MVNLITRLREEPQKTLSVLVVGGVFLASMLFGYISPRFSLANRSTQLLIGLVFGLPVILVLLRQPSFGLCILAVSGLLIPFTFSTGSQTTINATVLLIVLLLGLWILRGFAKRSWEFSIGPNEFFPIFCLDLVAVIAFLNGQLPWYVGTSKAPITAQIGGLAIFFFCTIVFFLVANQIKDQIWLERMTWSFLLVAGIYMVGRLVPQAGSVINRFFQYGSDGSLFWVWVPSLAFSQAIINKKLFWVLRVLLGCLGGIAMYIGLIQNQAWTSGWFPGLVALVVIVLFSFPKVWPVVLFGMVVALITRFDQVSRVMMAGDNEYSLMTRLQAWRIMVQIVSVSPLLGLGPANYNWYTPLFPILGYSVQFNSHNNYIDIIAQIGLIGLGCYLWFAWAVGRLGWRLRSVVPEGFQKAYVIGALGGLAGTLVAGMFGDWVIPFVYNVGYNGFRASFLAWLFFGGLVALGQMSNYQNPHR